MKISKLAKAVIGLGTQKEASDRQVKGWLKVVYVEPLFKAWYVELNDGSTWEVPAQAFVKPVDQKFLYKELRARADV